MTRRQISVAVVVLLAATALGCATSSHTLDEVHDRRQSLGWGPLYLGMTRSQLQDRIDRELDVEENLASVACGVDFSTLVFAGRELSLQWSEDGLTGELESIFVPLLPEETQDSPALSAALAATSRRLGATPEAANLLRLPDRRMSLLLKPELPDSGFYLSFDACLD